MPKRPVLRAPKFGAWLRLRRGDRSLEFVAGKLRDRLKPLDLKIHRSAVNNYEQGRVPDWPILAAFAAVYKVSLTEITERLRAGLEFPGSTDLLRPSSKEDIDLGLISAVGFASAANPPNEGTDGGRGVPTTVLDEFAGVFIDLSQRAAAAAQRLEEIRGARPSADVDEARRGEFAPALGRSVSEQQRRLRRKRR